MYSDVQQRLSVDKSFIKQGKVDEIRQEIEPVLTRGPHEM